MQFGPVQTTGYVMRIAIAKVLRIKLIASDFVWVAMYLLGCTSETTNITLNV